MKKFNYIMLGAFFSMALLTNAATEHHAVLKHEDVFSGAGERLAESRAKEFAQKQQAEAHAKTMRGRMEQVQKGAVNVKNTVVSSLNAASEGIKAVANKTSSAVSNGMSAVKTGGLQVVKNTKEYAQGAATYVANEVGFQAQTNAIKAGKALSAAKSTVADLASTATKGLVTATTQVKNSVQEGLIRGASVVKSSANAAREGITRGVAMASERTRQASTFVGNAMGLAQGAQDVKAANKQIASVMNKSSLDQLHNTFMDRAYTNGELNPGYTQSDVNAFVEAYQKRTQALAELASAPVKAKKTFG